MIYEEQTKKLTDEHQRKQALALCALALYQYRLSTLSRAESKFSPQLDFFKFRCRLKKSWLKHDWLNLIKKYGLSVIILLVIIIFTRS